MLECADLIEGARRDPDLLLKFSNEGVGWHLLTLAVPADDVPDIWIQLAIRRPFVAPNDKANLPLWSTAE